MTRVFKVAIAGGFFCWAGLSAGLARAEDSVAGAATEAPADENAPKVTCADADGVFTTNGSVSIAAPRKTVFAVLSDYGHMTRFSKNLKSSTVSARHGNQLTVIQEATGKAGPFSKDVHTVLSVTLKPNSKLTFTDTEKKDFDQYGGFWTLAGTGDTTVATYQLVAKLKGMAPGGIVKDSMKDNVGKMMVEIRTEAEKRSATASR